MTISDESAHQTSDRTSPGAMGVPTVEQAPGIIRIYISTNSFRGSVALSKIPRGAVVFSELSRAKSPFSVIILNTIEEVASRIAKVTCFIVEIVVPAGPPRKRQQYRGFCHLGCWGP